MSSPAESHRLEEFEKKKYENNTTYHRPNGVNIIKAMKLYSEKKSKTRMKLEEIIGEPVKNSFLDSTWDCRCQCDSECYCEGPSAWIWHGDAKGIATRYVKKV